MDETLTFSKKPTYPIESVDSALRLLLMVAQRPNLRISEASEELGVARSTAHRLMQMLQYYGFVQQDDAKAYVAGPSLIATGLAAIRNVDIREIARPFLERLRLEAQETVHLFRFQSGELTCLDSIESPHALRVGARTGMVLPAFASAGGRAVLAEYEPENLNEIYPSRRLPKAQPGTIKTKAELQQAIDDVRKHGYAVQHNESESGVSAVAAAIPSPSGPAEYVVTIAVPTSRFSEDAAKALGSAVSKTAQEIADAMPA
jgi:DNA-binding IclR family transcriptional regulator